jgi:hypothetical protein
VYNWRIKLKKIPAFGSVKCQIPPTTPPKKTFHPTLIFLTGEVKNDIGFEMY